MRIAGHDARMAADLVQANLSDLAQTTFGRAIGAGPQGITLTSDARIALLSLSATGRVAIIDVASRRVLGELGVGETPDGVAYSPLVVTRR